MIPELTLTRFGAVDDGYPLPQKFVDSTNGTVSIGVGSEISVDRELVSCGVPVHAWDHTFGELILMLDCESAEWETLMPSNLETLKRFSIISAELHFLGNAMVDAAPFVESLRFVNEYFMPVSTSSNNYSATWSIDGITLPDYVE